MKFKLIIDESAEEQVTVLANKRSDLTDDIERLVSGYSRELVGYIEREGVKLNLGEIACFVSEDDKVFALCKEGKYLIRSRLYQLEEWLPEDFVRINQSCIVSVKQISRFDSSISGTLFVKLKNGHTDYVSRRQLKSVKERLGIK